MPVSSVEADQESADLRCKQIKSSCAQNFWTPKAALILKKGLHVKIVQNVWFKCFLISPEVFKLLENKIGTSAFCWFWHKLAIFRISNDELIGRSKVLIPYYRFKLANQLIDSPSNDSNRHSSVCDLINQNRHLHGQSLRLFLDACDAGDPKQFCFSSFLELAISLTVANKPF